MVSRKEKVLIEVDLSIYNRLKDKQARDYLTALVEDAKDREKE